MINSVRFSWKERIRTGLSHTLFGLSGTAFNFVVSIVIVRAFSQSLWGEFTQSMLAVIMVNILTGWGNKEYLLKEFSFSSSIAALWQTSFTSRLVLFIPVILLLTITSETNLAQNAFLLLWVFTNFIARSFDSLIVFQRKFILAIVIESIGFLMLIVSLMALGTMVNLQVITFTFASSCLLKSILYSLYFRKSILTSWKGKFDLHYLILSIPYFLPPFIGFLQSRADTFAIALRLSEKELGEYYILISLLSYCHATAVLAITPFLKNIYRINPTGLHRIKKLFLSIGLAWSVMCIGGIFLILTFVYSIELSVNTYLLAWLTLPPYFLYFLLMQDFIRKGKPYPIVTVNAVAASLNFVISIALITRYGFIGGIISCALMQWMLLAGFTVAGQLQTRKQIAV